MTKERYEEIKEMLVELNIGMESDNHEVVIQSSSLHRKFMAKCNINGELHNYTIYGEKLKGLERYTDTDYQQKVKSMVKYKFGSGGEMFLDSFLNRITRKGVIRLFGEHKPFLSNHYKVNVVEVINFLIDIGVMDISSKGYYIIRPQYIHYPIALSSREYDEIMDEFECE